MWTHLRRSIAMAVICFLVCGLLYAVAGTGAAQVLFASQANGSIGPNGSLLIGQNWTGRAWFHGRPDDMGPYAANRATHISGGDNPLVANGVPGASGATNLGPRSLALLRDTRSLVILWHRLGVANPTPDLVTTSGSGYDPDISPSDALVQVPMVAKATGIAPARLRALIARQTHGPQWGFLGSPYVDVLTLNEALAQLRGRSS